MHEILTRLAAGSRVLDLGCDEGSFPAASTRATVVRLDRDLPRRRDSAFVAADAARLPFGDASFQAVISNHSLEHFVELDRVLAEVRRVLVPDGALFVAVPDASTLTDRLYRCLGKGGGHVNAFTSAEDTARRIGRATGLECVATRVLWSSLSFLNRRHAPRPLPRRIWLLGGGFERLLYCYVWISRRLDRRLGSRTGIYGWAFYFGGVPLPIDTTAMVNVCVGCGSGWPVDALPAGRKSYLCPGCGTRNPLC